MPCLILGLVQAQCLFFTFYKRDKINLFNPDQKDKNHNGVAFNINCKLICININHFINHLRALSLTDLAKKGALVKLIPLGFPG